jgi:hypothetical protein
MGGRSLNRSQLAEQACSTPGTLVMDLAAAVSILVPRATAWAETQAQSCLLSGTPLSDSGLALARKVGVQNPELIRVGIVHALPVPDDPELRVMALQTGLLGAQTLGLTLGHAVFLRRGHETDPRLLRHEFRHVQQYEVAGSISRFLPIYLSQVVQFGYANAPLECDARAYEHKSYK